MAKHRRRFTPEEKVAILRRHLLDKVPVSDLCDELGLSPNLFYTWQKAVRSRPIGQYLAAPLQNSLAGPKKIWFSQRVPLSPCTSTSQ